MSSRTLWSCSGPGETVAHLLQGVAFPVMEVSDEGLNEEETGVDLAQEFGVIQDEVRAERRQFFDALCTADHLIKKPPEASRFWV